jgi:hypothetical protein
MFGGLAQFLAGMWAWCHNPEGGFSATGRTIRPTFVLSHAANIPRREPVEPIQLEWSPGR